MSQFHVDYRDFKREDTVSSMKINLFNDDKTPITPNKSHTWIGKVVQGPKRTEKNYQILISGNNIFVPSKQMKDLPSGDYGLELWEEYDGETVIYPSAGFIGFHIHRNADDSFQSIDPTIDINQMLKSLHQAGLNVVVDKVVNLSSDDSPRVESKIEDGMNRLTFYLPQGQKGDQGDSAYQVWLKAGHQGTEQDFFNFLKGATGERGFRGPAGKKFNIKQTFPSINDMNASKGAGFEDGDFAMITSNVEDPDNAKLFVWNGTEYKLIGDLSGSTGMKGDTVPSPTIHGVTVNKLAAGATPAFDFIAVGDVPGNYNAVIGLPVGADGHTPVKGTDYWTESDINDLKAKIKAEVEDAVANGKY